MLKDYYNEIIPPWDSRYGKLGHIWKKFKFSELSKGKHHSKYYFIPPELVLTPHDGGRMSVYTKYFDNIKFNWIGRTYFSKLLYETCSITPQEYYDLFILRINTKLNRPKCPICKESVLFTYFSRGYNATCLKTKCFKKLTSVTTIDRWASMTKEERREILHNLTEAASSTAVQISAHYNKFINAGELNDPCVFYIAISKLNEFKFGISNNLEARSYMMGYKNTKVLYQGTRLQVANLERLIKLKLNNFIEYLDYTLPNLLKFINSYLLSIKELNI